jgi:hypothetical protein
MAEDLRTLSVAALRTAAERLGVDPYRLARFLAEGRLADVLDALARPRSMNPLKVVGLAETYLEFLEREIEIQEGTRPNGSRWRGF